MKGTGIPFEIDFSSSESLTSQVVQGFRTAMAHGAYLVVDRVLGYLLKHRSFPNEKYELVYRRGQTFGNPSKRPK